MTDEQIVEAFHSMWDNFPECVMLVKKSREIIATNRAGEQAGLKPGTRCSSIGSPERHRGCRCNEAVDERRAVSITYPSPFGKAFGYWIPVANKPEWIIHFGVGATFEYESANVVVETIEKL